MKNKLEKRLMIAIEGEITQIVCQDIT